MVIAATIFLSTGIAALTGFTPQAHAIKVDPISDMLCPTVNNGTSYLGGISQPIINGFTGKTGKVPWEGLFGVWSIPQADRDSINKGDPVVNEWTTLERYGYYGTEYTNWIGMQTHYPLERVLDEVFSDGKLPFMGTGGNPGGFGAYMEIQDGASSPLFSQSVLDCIPVASHATVSAGNTFQKINQSITAVTLNFYVMSSNLSLSDDNSLLRPLGEVFEKVIAGDSNTKGLKDLLFLDFLFPLLMIGAIVMIFTYSRTWSAIKIGKQVLWMVIILIVGMVLLSKPLIISGTVDKVVGTVTGVLSKVVLGSGAETPECKLEAGSPQEAERELSCYLWMQNVYSFWVEGQFGKSYEEGIKLNKDPAEKAGVVEYGERKDAKTYVGLNASNWAGINKNSFSASSSLEGSDEKLGSQNFLALTALGYDPRTYYPDYESLFENGKPIAAEPQADGTRGVFKSFNPHLGKRKNVNELKNWPYYQMDTSATWPVSNGYNHSEVAYNQLVIDNNPYWKNPSNAPTSSLLSIAYTIVPNIVTFTFSLTLITLQISLTLLIVLAPFFLALGLIPGFGNRVIYKWVNMLTGITVRRIIITFFFFMYLKFYFIILNSGLELSLRLIAITIFSLVLFNLRDSIASAIIKALQIKQGGDMSETERNSYAKAAALVSGSGVGSLISRIQRESRLEDTRRYEAKRKAEQKRRRSERKRDLPGSEYASENYDPFKEAAEASKNSRRRRPLRGAAGVEDPQTLNAFGNHIGENNYQPHARTKPRFALPAGLTPTPEIGSRNPHVNKESERAIGAGPERLAIEAGFKRIDLSNIDRDSYRRFGFTDPNEENSIHMDTNLRKQKPADVLGSREALKNLTYEERLAIAIHTGRSYEEINRRLYGVPEWNTNKDEYKQWAESDSTNGISLTKRIEDSIAGISDPNLREEKINSIIKDEAALIAFDSYTNKKTLEEHSAVLDKALLDRTEEHRTLYRGVSLNQENLENMGCKDIEDISNKYKLGSSIKVDGYQSASVDEAIASTWSRQSLGGSLVYEIRTTGGVPVSDVSLSTRENETLIPRGKEYVVVGNHTVQRSNGKKTVVVQMVEVDGNGNQI